MRNSRSKNAKLNMISGLMQELTVVICGLILPRIILSHFGSTYNGIVNSVTQFLGFSVVLRSGLGAVTNAALYKPLADGDMQKVSGIMVATDQFMKKVAWLLIAFILGFAFLYPLAVLDEFNYWFSFWLVVIIGISTFVENMFSIKYKILLQADQKYYIQTIFAIIAQILSTIFSIVLIWTECNIHMVKLGAAIGLMSTPILLKIYVNKNYNIDWTAPADNIALNARWDAFAQQLATIVNNNVPTVIMTLMLPLKEISVYSVYYMAANNMTKLLTSCLNGLKSTFGNMIAKGEAKHLRKRFCDVEYVVFAASTVIFTVTAIMLTPFILVYTKGITDVDYNRFALGIAMVTVCMMNVLRIPYQLVVEAAGHFRQTRNGAFVEVILNVLVSAIFAKLFGIIGVIMGGFIASIVRTTQFAWYANKKILSLSTTRTLKNYLVHFSMGALLIIFVPKIINLDCDNYLEWIRIAVTVFILVSIVVFILSALFSPAQFKSIHNYLFVRRKKHWNK